ncbi:hypothetical protein, partial [Elstera litoralis]|uniref:hypothetical protein n=1 Tax=Elstera litoralis TaxID=552518 RepID=UPI001E3250B5
PITDLVAIFSNMESLNSKSGAAYAGKRVSSLFSFLFTAAVTLLLAMALLRIRVFKNSTSTLSLGGLRYNPSYHPGG